MQIKFGSIYRAQISDNASAAYNFAFAIAALAAPLISVLMYDEFGFPAECSYFALLMLCTALV